MVLEHAFFSVHNDHKTPELVDFAREVANTLPIISSGGTARFLHEHGIDVTPVREVVESSMRHRLALANLQFDADERLTATQIMAAARSLAGDAILGHRVVTLRPEVQGPILATRQMEAELEALGMVRIVLVRISFYPLDVEIAKPSCTVESVFEQTDVGGPTGTIAAVKGDRLPVIDPQDHAAALSYLSDGRVHVGFRRYMQAKAARAVSMYYGSLASFLAIR